LRFDGLARPGQLAIVVGTPLGIAENLVGGVDLRHATGCVGLPGDVRVILPGQPSVDDLDDVRLRFGIELKDLVEVPGRPHL
jgi:hypothetical protein